MNKPGTSYFGILLGRSQGPPSLGPARPAASRPANVSAKPQAPRITRRGEPPAHEFVPQSEVFAPCSTPPIRLAETPARPEDRQRSPQRRAGAEEQGHGAVSPNPVRRAGTREPGSAHATETPQSRDITPQPAQPPHDPGAIVHVNERQTSSGTHTPAKPHAAEAAEPAFVAAAERAGYLPEDAAAPSVPSGVAEAVRREPRIDTLVQWPAQLAPEQRSAIRTQLERYARQRTAAVPGNKTVAEQRVEIRVDQLNVNVGAPQQPAPARPASTAPAEAPFAGFFMQRSLG
jgi:hypothetical protein